MTAGNLPPGGAPWRSKGAEEQSRRSDEATASARRDRPVTAPAKGEAPCPFPARDVPGVLQGDELPIHLTDELSALRDWYGVDLHAPCMDDDPQPY